MKLFVSKTTHRDQSGDKSPHSKETCLDEDTLENDVRYGIADCRKRLRSRRATLRTHHHPPKDDSNGKHVSPAAQVESYAEILATVSLNQSSLSRLVECLLGPADGNKHVAEESAKREEAVIT